MANYALYGDVQRRLAVDVTANKTLAKDTDSGLVENVIKDAITVTLPAAAAGLMFTVRNGGVAPTSAATGARSDASVAVTIAPNGTDTIGGAGRAAANSNLVNTKTTSHVGDEVTLLGVAGAWQIVAIRGTWA
jgi:hypothetical protein